MKKVKIKAFVLVLALVFVMSTFTLFPSASSQLHVSDGRFSPHLTFYTSGTDTYGYVTATFSSYYYTSSTGYIAIRAETGGGTQSTFQAKAYYRFTGDKTSGTSVRHENTVTNDSTTVRYAEVYSGQITTNAYYSGRGVSEHYLISRTNSSDRYSNIFVYDWRPGQVGWVTP